MRSRGVAATVLALGFIPWAWLLIFQALGLYLLIVLVSVGDLGACFDAATLPTLAMLWLAAAPLPLGILAALTGLRHSRVAARAGLALMLVGLPLCVMSTGRTACPGRVLPFDDSDDGNVPVPGVTLAACLAVFVCFAVLMWSTWRDT